MYVSHLECSRCHKEYESEKIAQLCSCGYPLLVRYDLERIKRNFKKEDLLYRKPSLWRYRELLPIRRTTNIISFDEGMTPLLHLKKLGSKIGIPDLFMKDEGILPTGTFKARGATVGVSKAKELGVEELAMPTNGNAGAAWSAYCAAAGIRSTIVIPASAPSISFHEISITGASLYLVDGLIPDAGKIVSRAIKKYGWYDASTLKEPYRIEGKKTMGLEIAEQCGWKMPDVIIYPTGGGVGIIGIYKALKELQYLGWIDEKIPRLVTVQSTGCAPIVSAWEKKKMESLFWENAQTLAFGLNVSKAIGDFLVLQALYDSQGYAIAVTDIDILEKSKLMASIEGIFMCPEGAATLCAAIELSKKGWIHSNEKVVLLNTGTGIKYTESSQCNPPILNPNDDLPGN